MAGEVLSQLNPLSLFYPQREELGSHGVIRFANYSLYEFFTDVHTPPDMRAQSSLLLSKPVSPILLLQDKGKGIFVPMG